MSIENQLKMGFKQTARQFISSPRLDARIEQSFDAHVRKQAKSRPGYFASHKYGRIALVAVCLLLFSGVAYASTLLYSLQANNFTMEASGTSALRLSKDQLSEITGSLHQVRGQLAPGESAFVYIAALESIKLPEAPEGLALHRVNHPQPYTDINQWKQLLGKGFQNIKTPTVLPDGFTFNRAELEGPIGMLDMDNYKKYNTLLKAQAAAAPEKIAWQKAVQEDAHEDQAVIPKSPRLVYTNSQKDQIEISYTLIPPSDKKVDIKVKTSDASSAEKVQVADKDAYYTVNNSNFLSDTGKSQEIVWVEQREGQTVMYHAATSSVNVTKADLLLVAGGLK
jgi:hypothetical protein